MTEPVEPVAPVEPVEPAAAPVENLLTNVPEPVVPQDPAAAPNPNAHLPPDVTSIYGEHSQIEWPDGTSDELKNNVALKPFVQVENDKGKVNVAGILKAYVDTKKMVGAKGIIKPTEYAEKHEVDDFYKQTIGWEPDKDQYKVERPETAKIGAEVYDSLKDFAHENRVPAETAGKLMAHLEGQAAVNTEKAEKEHIASQNEGLEALRSEWGSAFDSRTALAARLVNELGDDNVMNYLVETGETNNPFLIKLLADAAAKVYKEGNFNGTKETGGNISMMTPNEAESEINMIRGDKKHPFNDKNHPNHKNATADMLKLYEVKNSVKRA
jgi:hypothetical protein